MITAERKPHVLIIGFGFMGQVRAAALTRLDVEWTSIDPYTNAHIIDKFGSHIDLSPYTHVIVATRSLSHLGLYSLIREQHPDIPILIEKPLTHVPSDLPKFENDPHLTVGFTERFNVNGQHLLVNPYPKFMDCVWDGSVCDSILHPLDLICCTLDLYDPDFHIPEFNMEGPRISFTVRNTACRITLLPKIKERAVTTERDTFSFAPHPSTVLVHTRTWLYYPETNCQYAKHSFMTHHLWMHLRKHFTNPTQNALAFTAPDMPDSE